MDQIGIVQTFDALFLIEFVAFIICLVGKFLI